MYQLKIHFLKKKCHMLQYGSCWLSKTKPATQIVYNSTTMKYLSCQIQRQENGGSGAEGRRK